MKKLIIILVIVFMASMSWAAEITQTLTFQWEDTNNPAIMQDWRLYWAEATGGPYDEAPVAIIPYAGTGPTFSSPADAKVIGTPGTHVTKFFVIVACGNTPQEDGTTAFECSENSNEINYDFWIPAGAFSAPVSFQIIPTP